MSATRNSLSSSAARRSVQSIVVAVVFLSLLFPASGQVHFEDAFDGGASPLWGNEVGDWQAVNGEYQASQATGAPPYRYSSLPFDLTDFVVEVDIRDIGDGGIWLRSRDNQNGVLLVTGGDGWWNNGNSPQKGRDIYWHVLENGVGQPAGFLSRTANVFDPGVADATIRVAVFGDVYKAYVNGMLRTTLVNSTYSHGKVALYDAWNPGQAYERVQVTPVLLQSILELDFNVPVPSGVNDVNGLGTGFTHWLPGTGGSIPRDDPNLNLESMPDYLAFTSQRSDISQFNGFGRNLATLDAPGVRLTNMVGRDLRVTARFDDVNVTGLSDQLLLYVGTNADNVLRGGFHENGTFDPSGDTGQFILAGNTGSGDFGFPEIGEFGFFATGDDVVLSLSRIGGVWSLDWENLTNPATSGGYSGIDMPSLDAASDLYVGLMHMDARNFTPQTAKIDYFRVEVGAPIPEPSSLALSATAALPWLRPRRRTP